MSAENGEVRELAKKADVPLVAGRIMPSNIDGVYRMARAVWNAGLCGRSIKDENQAFIVLCAGLEAGMGLMSSLKHIYVVNNLPAIWGDGATALIRASGKLEYVVTTFEGSGETRTAITKIKRIGEPIEHVYTYSWADAKRAGSTGKDTYQKYPDRMLFWRSRSWAYRDVFADVLMGLGIAEEEADAIPETVVSSVPSTTPTLQLPEFTEPPKQDAKTSTTAAMSPTEFAESLIPKE